MGMMQPWISRGIGGHRGHWEAGEFPNGFQKADGQMLQHVPMMTLNNNLSQWVFLFVASVFV